MCAGVFYIHDGHEYRYYFPNPQAALPVRAKDGSVQRLPWGRRKQQQSNLPKGGWATLESIYTGRWNQYFPISVKIPLLQFMEKDIEEVPHWFDITKGKWVQGLVAHDGLEHCVYIVTVEPKMAEAVHNRWPRILSGGAHGES